VSITYSSYAFIGVKIDDSKLRTTKKSRSCGHIIKDIDKENFCGTCGKRIWNFEEVPIPQFNTEENDWEEFPIGHSLCGYAVLYHGSDYGPSGTYVAIEVVKDDHHIDEHDENMIKIPEDIDALKIEMKNKLEPLGFWDEKTFGLWSVLNVC